MRTIGRMVQPLRDRIALAIGRGVLRLVNDAARMQRVQVQGLAGETIADAEHWHPYGSSSHPLPGAEALILAVGGSREHPIVLIADRRYRLSGLRPGEVAAHDDQGQKVHLTRDGIVIKSHMKVRLEAPVIEIDAAQAVHIGAGGVGPTYTPSQIRRYEQGVPSTTLPPVDVEGR